MISVASFTEVVTSTMGATAIGLLILRGSTARPEAERCDSGVKDSVRARLAIAEQSTVESGKETVVIEDMVSGERQAVAWIIGEMELMEQLCASEGKVRPRTEKRF